MRKQFYKIALLSLAAAASAVSFGQTALLAGTSVLNPSLPGFPSTYFGIAYSGYAFTGVDSFSNVSFTGFLNSYVFEDSVTGNLGFAWIVTNDATSKDAINHLSLTSYTGYATAAAQDPNGSGYPTVSLLASRSSNGNVVSFDFVNFGGNYSEIAPGTGAAAQWVFTDAKNYTLGSAQLSDGGIATVQTFAPAPVPEPSSMLALGGVVVALLRRRNK